MQLNFLQSFVGPSIYGPRPGITASFTRPTSVPFEIAALGDGSVRVEVAYRAKNAEGQTLTEAQVYSSESYTAAVAESGATVSWVPAGVEASEFGEKRRQGSAGCGRIG